MLAGLLATGLLWLRLMAALGADLPLREGLATFFVGQLGKYIPGSVWSIGAQAHMAGRLSVPPRTTVAAGLLFLGYHVATAVDGGRSRPAPRWPGVAVAGVGVGAPARRVGGRAAPRRRPPVGRRVAGRPVPSVSATPLVALALMATAWAAYSAGLVLLSPGLPWRDVVALGGAFALAYAVGVVIVLAPAGVGAREGLFVAAAHAAAGGRRRHRRGTAGPVVHTVADGVMAAGWWYAASGRAVRGRDDRPRARTTPPSMPGHRGG